MRLKLNSDVPNFNVLDIFDKEISINALKGKKIMLSFYRYAACPLCNLRVNSLINKHSEYQEKGLTMLAFFESPKESMLEYVAKQKPPFSLIPDPDRIVYKQFGVESSISGFFAQPLKNLITIIKAMLKGFMPGKMEGEKALLPADFLINEAGKIEIAFYGKSIGDHLPLVQIEEWLNK